MAVKSILFIPLLLICGGCTTAQKANAANPFISCSQDRVRLKARSEELQRIVNADQDDRKGPFDSIDWTAVAPRDEARRKRVGEIFGEGCFSTSADYAAAALVYQHGNVPDHFFQTFLWAKRAADLADPHQIKEMQELKKLMAEGTDRYLMNIQHKQLFGTQASRPSMNPKDCWCLEEIEPTFPDQKRAEYLNRNIEQILSWLDTTNSQNPKCRAKPYCEKSFKPSPAGTIPGFW